MRIQQPTDAGERVEELGDPLKRIVFALDGYQERISGSEAVEREQVQGGGTVKDDEVVAVADWSQGIAQQQLPVRHIDHFYFGTGEVSV